MNAKLDLLQHEGIATYKELFEAKAIRKIYRFGINKFGSTDTVLLDTTGKQWNLDPEDELYHLKKTSDVRIPSPKK